MAERAPVPLQQPGWELDREAFDSGALERRIGRSRDDTALRCPVEVRGR